MNFILSALLGGLLTVSGTAGAACTAGVVLEDVAETTPSADFVGQQDGTVIHLKTGLIWKRCVEGQSWNGSICLGEPLKMSWSAALQASAQSEFAGATDWRVPNRKELESLVEYCGHSPAINSFEFPPTPSERFWSSTTLVSDPALAWNVYFSDGYSGISNKELASQMVRLVRTAPPGTLLAQQRLNFGAAPVIVVGGSGVLTVGSSAGLEVVIDSRTADVCTLSGTTVFGVAAGFCIIAANQGGNAQYYPAAEVTLNFMIGKLDQTITFGAAPGIAVGASNGLTATASSGLAVTLTSSTPGTCSVTGTTVTGSASGTCTILANQGGDATYKPAPVASLSFAIGSGGSGGGDPPPPSLSYPLNLAAGWHLLGNSLNTPIAVSAMFGNAQIVESVWKWVPATATWAFYSPTLNSAQLQAYLASKRFQPLTAINPGEAYWLKLKFAANLGEQSGDPALLSAGQLLAGWNLVTTGEAQTPAELNAALAATPPAAGTVAQSFVSLWAWDRLKNRWLFYSPALEADGPGKNKEYADRKGYLDFATEQKTIGKGTGFWIRK